MLKAPYSYYFLSRPRRFGKSLLISILEEVFRGNQRLFKGLHIYDKTDWKEHSVARIDFSKLTYKDGKELEEALIIHFDIIARDYGLSLTKTKMKERWAELISKLHEKTQMLVVLLIDEYDVPINSFIEQSTILQSIQDTIREFYKTTKALDAY